MIMTGGEALPLGGRCRTETRREKNEQGKAWRKWRTWCRWHGKDDLDGLLVLLLLNDVVEWCCCRCCCMVLLNDVVEWCCWVVNIGWFYWMNTVDWYCWMVFFWLCFCGFFFLQVAASDPWRIKRRKSTAHETNQCDDGVVGWSDTVEGAQSGTGPVGTGTTMHGGAGKKWRTEK